MKYVVLLRGINVGGHNKVQMKLLVAALEEAGCQDVATYIQSGNIVLSSSLGATGVQQLVTDTIHNTFNFTVPLMVKTAPEWQTLIDRNPLSDMESDEQYLKSLNMTIFSQPLSDLDRQHLEKKCEEGERCVFIGDAAYFWYGNGQANSKLAGAVAKIPYGTSRNWRTVLKFSNMLVTSK